MNRLRLTPLLALAALLVVGGLSLLSLVPPRPVPATASKAVFSAERAWDHLEVIAAEPRPQGSPAADAAREYIVAELEALGLAPRIEASTRTRRLRDGMERAFELRNVVVEVAGTDPTGAVLMLSHYDSHWTGTGAGDAGLSVAALLEAMRVLAAGPPLRNDLVLLLTDGEEYGMLGARSFVESDPAMARVRVALNFEGRGSAGPVLMFETGPGNAALVRTFHRGAARPIGSSLFPEAYRFLPNYTDFTAFLDAGVRGLNFAHIGRAETYHHASDTPDNASPRTLQHQGDLAVSMARAFGDLDLDALPGAASGDAVFFNLPGLGMVRYPAGLSLPLALAVVALWLAAVVWGRRRRAVRLWGVAAGLGTGILALVITVGAAWVAGRVAAMQPDAGTLTDKLVVREWPYMLALIAIALAAVLGGVAGIGRWLGAASVTLGVLLIPALLGVAAAVVVPGASYLLVWPAAFGIGAAWVAAAAGTRPDTGRASADREPWVAIALLVPVALLWGPHLSLFLTGLTLNMVLALGVVAGLAAMSVAAVGSVGAVRSPGRAGRAGQGRGRAGRAGQGRGRGHAGDERRAGGGAAAGSRSGG
jgi:hypothetical protein